MKIKETAINDRPRERLAATGVKSLKNSELLAIILRSGNCGENVLHLAERILAKFDGNLNSLSLANLEQLQEIKGIGIAKASEILATFEMAKRLHRDLPEKKEAVNSPEKLAAFVYYEMCNLEHEEFWIIMLNVKNEFVRKFRISIGTINETLINPLSVFKEVVKSNCERICLVHNHPSGNVLPSDADVVLTKDLVEAGKILQVKILDHLIIGKGNILHGEGFYSFKKAGRF